MRFKWITVLSFCLLLSLGFGQITLAQDSPAVRTIPITSRGFGAKLSPDGKTLVTFENTLLLNLKQVDPATLPMHVFDISTGKERGQLSDFTDYASDVAFTSSGRRMVSLHMNGDLIVWDVPTMKAVKRFQTPLLGNVQLKMFPDNKRILTVFPGIPHRMLVIDTDTGAITQTFGNHFDSFMDFQANYTQFPAQGDVMFASFGLSANGKLVATATANDEVGIRTLADNQYQVVRQKSDKPALFNIRQLVFTPDNKALLYFDGADNKIHIWDIAAKSEKAALDIGSDSFALSADGKTIAWITRVKDAPSTISFAPLDAPDKAVKLLTVKDGLQAAPRVSWLNFTPKGKQLVVGGFFDRDEVGNEIYVMDLTKF
ncbi:MAG: hypothetical protein GC179_22635 [Anaerolineaceae bacterium]|nr:hypothetical protein [Anaerolineaceae bacterium]